MPKLILVTVGTSALFEHSDWKNGSNGNYWEKPEDLIARLEQEALNNQSTEYNHQKNQVLSALKSNLEYYYANNEQGLNTLSAEVASLLAMEKAERKDPTTGKVIFKIGKIGSGDKIVLLHSDTVDGKLCAEVNEIVLKSNIAGRVICGNVEIKKIDGLQVDDPEKFLNPGLKNLETAIKSYSGGTQDYYLNVTGGFKGVLPYAALLAWDNLMTVVYLFERSTGIIVIPSSTIISFGGALANSWVPGNL